MNCFLTTICWQNVWVATRKTQTKLRNIWTVMLQRWQLRLNWPAEGYTTILTTLSILGILSTCKKSHIKQIFLEWILLFFEIFQPDWFKHQTSILCFRPAIFENSYQPVSGAHQTRMNGEVKNESKMFNKSYAKTVEVITIVWSTQKNS